jgi:hypothetical protein
MLSLPFLSAGNSVPAMLRETSTMAPGSAQPRASYTEQAVMNQFLIIIAAVNAGQQCNPDSLMPNELVLLGNGNPCSCHHGHQVARILLCTGRYSDTGGGAAVYEKMMD